MLWYVAVEDTNIVNQGNEGPLCRQVCQNEIIRAKVTE